MFLQMHVPEQDRSCLRFIWRPRTNEPVHIYEYKRHVFGAKKFSNLCNLCSQAIGTGKRKRVANCRKGNTKQLLNGRFHQIIKNLKEAIDVFNQLHPLFSRQGFELKKWISNNDAVTEAIPGDLQSISITKQVEMEPNTEGSSVLGLQWTVINDSLQVCRGKNNEVEALITQRKILSLVSSIFDPIGFFAPFSVLMRRLLKGIWTKNGQHWDNEMAPGHEAEILRWKQQLPIVTETSIDRRYFNRLKAKTELNVFFDA